jgi:hypothetical protein
MSRSRTLTVGLAAVALLIGTRRYLACAATPSSKDTRPIALRAASGATIEFQTQNGQTVDHIPPQVKEIPHLVLFRNGVPTDALERTLTLTLTELDVPAGGITLTLTLQTEHSDPDEGDDAARIQVWEETRCIANPTPSSRAGVAVAFLLILGPEVMTDHGSIPTPTDYLGYRVTLSDGDPAAADLTFAEEYALLLEAQEVVSLPLVQEASEGAAPDTLMVSFCDMVPFRHTTPAGPQQVRRAEVTPYVRGQLIPRMVEAFRLETDDWGFPWHEPWTSYRPEDGERLGVALGDGETWFHGFMPTDAHAGIALNVSGDLAGTAYATLTDRLISCFYHELFHNVQRDLVFHHGGHGDPAGVEGVWHFFYEGTAAAAASVGSPQTEYDAQVGAGHYLLNANRFLGDATSSGQLNTPVTEGGLYASALYWRFLVEQCGGMGVIREALIALYSGDIVDIRTSTDVADALPKVLDRAVSRAGCPFETHAASLEAFARAIYALRLQGGRCGSIGQDGGCGLYDPAGLYSPPPAARVTYTGSHLSYDARVQAEPAGIPNSFGIDFIEIDLDQSADGMPLTIEVVEEPGAAARFSVQVWEVAVDGGAASPSRDPIVLAPDAEGRLSTTYGAIEWRTMQRLAVLIVRVDAHEAVDPVGAYTLTLR